MRAVTAQVRVGRFDFGFYAAIEIDSSWKTLTDTAVITLPRRVSWQGKNLYDEIRRGDQVSIRVGYDYAEDVLFEGYVSNVKAGVPVVIEAQDEMWRLKQSAISKAWRQVSLGELVGAIVPAGIAFEAAQIDLGPFRADRVSAAKVLEYLRTTYGIYAWFRDGLLKVGFPYSETTFNRHKIEVEKAFKSDHLSYERNDDQQIKIRAVSIQPTGGSISVEVGAAAGETHTRHYYNVPEETLRQLATEALARAQYAGYTGHFSTFGAPRIRHSDSCILESSEYPDRVGEYLVDRVFINVNETDGYQQTLTIGPTT